MPRQIWERGGQGKAYNVELSKLSHRHEQIVNWLIANPDKSLKECSAFFKVSQPWLSIIVNSDMFQARYRQRCEQLGVMVVHTMGNRLAGVAAQALDKISSRLEADPSDKFLLESSSMVLSAIGYSTKGAPAPNGVNVNIQNNQSVAIPVDGSALAAARERMAQRYPQLSSNPTTNEITPSVDKEELEREIEGLTIQDGEAVGQRFGKMVVDEAKPLSEASVAGIPPAKDSQAVTVNSILESIGIGESA